MTSPFREQSIFPLELYDHIIDYLHDNVAALASCALVCSAWLPSSQYHLSSQLALYETRAENLARRFTSPSFMITCDRAVCHLRIDRQSTDKRACSHLAVDVRTIIDQPTSTQIKQLTLTGVKWRSHRTIAEDLLSFTMIKELYIEENMFIDLKNFIRVLSAFPHLQTLDIRRSDCIALPSWHSLPRIRSETPVMPNLQVLRIVGELVQPLLYYLWPSSKCRVRNLSIRSLRSSDVLILCEFIKELGPRLETLELGLRGQDVPEELGKEVMVFFSR
jgi:hypothetical protein